MGAGHKCAIGGNGEPAANALPNRVDLSALKPQQIKREQDDAL
jgi:hypothetical protein